MRKVISPRLGEKSRRQPAVSKARAALKTLRARSPGPGAANLDPQDPRCQCPARLFASPGRTTHLRALAGGRSPQKSVRTCPGALEPTSQSGRRSPPPHTGTWRSGREGRGVSGGASTGYRGWWRGLGHVGVSPTLWRSCSGGGAGCSLSGEVLGCCARLRR